MKMPRHIRGVGGRKIRRVPREADLFVDFKTEQSQKLTEAAHAARLRYSTLKAIMIELERSRKHYPGNAGRAEALLHGASYVAEALAEHKSGVQSALAVYMRAVECAAIAIRVIEEGDALFPYRAYETGVMNDG
jgi:hypothetical protein